MVRLDAMEIFKFFVDIYGYGDSQITLPMRPPPIDGCVLENFGGGGAALPHPVLRTLDPPRYAKLAALIMFQRQKMLYPVAK